MNMLLRVHFLFLIGLIQTCQVFGQSILTIETGKVGENRIKGTAQNEDNVWIFYSIKPVKVLDNALNKLHIFEDSHTLKKYRFRFHFISTLPDTVTLKQISFESDTINLSWNPYEIVNDFTLVNTQILSISEDSLVLTTVPSSRIRLSNYIEYYENKRNYVEILTKVKRSQYVSLRYDNTRNYNIYPFSDMKIVYSYLDDTSQSLKYTFRLGEKVNIYKFRIDFEDTLNNEIQIETIKLKFNENVKTWRFNEELGDFYFSNALRMKMLKDGTQFISKKGKGYIELTTDYEYDPTVFEYYWLVVTKFILIVLSVLGLFKANKTLLRKHFIIEHSYNK